MFDEDLMKIVEIDFQVDLLSTTDLEADPFMISTFAPTRSAAFQIWRWKI